MQKLQLKHLLQKTLLSSLRIKKTGATLMELMMMLLVVSLALTTMFYTLGQSITFARDTEARVKAIALAREWIEAMINIRNTNWLRFSSDRKNCWNVSNYNASCINDNNPNSESKINAGTYVLHTQNGAWHLVDKKNLSFKNEHFSSPKTNPFLIWYKDGWYTGKSENSTHKFNDNIICKNIDSANNASCRTIFSREISVTYPDKDRMKIISRVHWLNVQPRKVELSMELTNWKSHYSQ